MKQERYEWRQDLLALVPSQRRWPRVLARAGIAVASVLAVAAFAVAFDLLDTSPEELYLQQENRFLQEQLAATTERIQDFSDRLDELEGRDQEIYRVMLQADSIPAAVRMVGVGGSEPEGEFNRFSPTTAELVGNLSAQLDRMERRFALQSGSTAELLAQANAFEARTRELPSIMPATAPLTSFFGYRTHPIYKTRRFHAGIDFTTRVGTPVYATGDGIVEAVEWQRNGYGTHIVIRHPAAGYKTLYGHLSKVMSSVQPGKRVKRGQLIALTGNSGLSAAPHLHYEVHDINGQKLNPLPFLAPDLSASEYRDILDMAVQE